MSRLQLAGVAALSVLATLAILSGGAGASGLSARVVAALSVPTATTVPVAVLAAPAPEQAPVPQDAADDVEATPIEPVAAETSEAAPQETVPDEEPEEKPATPTTTSTTPAPAREEEARTNIDHVFVIDLAGHGFDAAFGPDSPATYLNTQLRPQGALLAGYETLGRSVLADRLALISGQPPNADTQRGCPVFTEIAAAARPSRSGEIADPGCVYPDGVTTVADQLTADGRVWRAYVEDLDRGPDGVTVCRRPAPGAPDPTGPARPDDGYATRNNPFVYFQSLLFPGDCDTLDGPLDRLAGDLRKADTTPAYSYIAPNLCHDGSETPCVDGSPGGLTAADAFLAAWVPKILASPAFEEHGLLIVTFAGDVTAGPDAGPDAPVRTGTLLLSRFATAGSTVDAEADPYTLLRTVQDGLGLRPLARAAAATSLLDTVLASARIAQRGDD